MITVQNNASAVNFLSVRYYESIMNSQSGSKDCIMKESKIIGFKFDEKMMCFSSCVVAPFII